MKSYFPLNKTYVKFRACPIENFNEPEEKNGSRNEFPIQPQPQRCKISTPVRGTSDFSRQPFQPFLSDLTDSVSARASQFQNTARCTSHVWQLYSLDKWPSGGSRNTNWSNCRPCLQRASRVGSALLHKEPDRPQKRPTGATKPPMKTYLLPPRENLIFKFSRVCATA